MTASVMVFETEEVKDTAKVTDSSMRSDRDPKKSMSPDLVPQDLILQRSAFHSHLPHHSIRIHKWGDDTVILTIY